MTPSEMCADATELLSIRTSVAAPFPLSLLAGDLLDMVAGAFRAVPRYDDDGAINVRIAVHAVILPVAHLLVLHSCSGRTNNLMASTAG